MTTELSSVNSKLVNVAFSVNGTKKTLKVEPHSILIDSLRDDLGLTGTKLGCGEGVCGACSVLINGNVVCSCLMFTVEAESSNILTIEGLSASGKLDPLQEAFVEKDGLQCGFCTAGQVLAARAFLSHHDSKRPITEAEIKEALEGNLCRCGAYNGIIEAVKKVSRQSGR